MLDFRSPLILGAAPAGLVLACLGWLVLGGPGHVVSPVAQAEERLAAIPTPGRIGVAQTAALGAAPGASLFAADVASPSIRLDGISRTARRTAALLSFNGAAAQWVTAGSTLQGATLAEVSAGRVVVDDINGRRVIRLGETAAGITGSEAAAPLAGDQPPPGVRMPPPPASAPGAG